MKNFTVLEKRGPVIAAMSVGRVARRANEYDEGRGPRGNSPGAPRDLERSRRVGLSRIVCSDCGGVRDQGHLHHEAGCEADYTLLVRQTTGPLAANQTAADVGWK